MAYQSSANGSLFSADHQNSVLTLPQAEEILNAFLAYVREEETKEYLHLQKENFVLKFKNSQLNEKHHDDKKNALEEEVIQLNQRVSEMEEVNKKQLEKIADLEKQQVSHNALEKEKKNLVVKVAALEAMNNKHLEKISDLETQIEAYCHVCDGEKKSVDTKLAGLEALNKGPLEKFTVLEKQKEDNHLVSDGEKIVVEDQVAEAKPNAADSQPLVVKNLFKVKNENYWHTSLDETEEPVKISMKDNNLIIDDVYCPDQLILEGMVTQYQSDPFKNKSDGCFCDRMMVSNLLINVRSCALAEIYLCNQRLAWDVYEKMVSSGTIQNFYFSGGEILTKKGYGLGSLYEVIRKLPKVERFAYLGLGNIHKETFKKLLKLPAFAMLKEFYLDSINYHDFDKETFLKFMKNHSKARFTLGFLTEHSNDMVKLNEMKQMLESCAPVNMLEIKY